MYTCITLPVIITIVSEFRDVVFEDVVIDNNSSVAQY